MQVVVVTGVCVTAAKWRDGAGRLVTTAGHGRTGQVDQAKRSSNCLQHAKRLWALGAAATELSPLGEGASLHLGTLGYCTKHVKIRVVE